MRKKKGKTSRGLNIFCEVWSIVFMVASVAFVAGVLYLDLLPMKYVYAVAVGVIVIFLVLSPALFFDRFRKSRKIICLVLSVLIMCLYGGSIAFIMSTMEFMETITQTSGASDTYYAMVKDDSAYTQESDLAGMILQAYQSSGDSEEEARSILQERQNVHFETVDSLSDLIGGLLDGSYDVIFISEAYYTTISSEYSEFKDNTRIIAIISVSKETKDVAKVVSVEEEPFNVYISGLDTEGSISKVSRSDVNMILTVNPSTHKVLLTSLPRDAMIHLPSKGGAQDKLTHTGLYGIEETIGAVEQLMGIDINYYVKVNYSTVVQLVDAIGGITVNSDYTFVTHGMDVYYEFYEGENQLDGSRALAFARERKSFADGDFQRNRDQQLVMEGILEKALSSTTILTRYTSILEALEDTMEINMSQEEMKNLVKMQIETMPEWDIQRQSVLGRSGSDLCYSTGDYYVSVVYLDSVSLNEAVDSINQVLKEK